MNKFAKYMPMGDFPARKGSAMQVSLARMDNEKVRLFIEMAQQTKPKPPSGSYESPFDWKEKIFISLKEEEVGNILACLHGRKPEVDIIHKYPMNAPTEKQKTTTLKVKQGEFRNEMNWGFSIRQKIGNGDAVSVNIYVGVGDVEILMMYCLEALKAMYL